MNHLPPAGEETWTLPAHAYVVAHERDDGSGLLTIYDCGAAQSPPTAQLLGRLVAVEADHDRRPQPTGYALSLTEPAHLERQPADRWVIRTE